VQSWVGEQRKHPAAAGARVSEFVSEHGYRCVGGEWGPSGPRNSRAQNGQQNRPICPGSGITRTGCPAALPARTSSRLGFLSPQSGTAFQSGSSTIPAEISRQRPDRPGNPVDRKKRCRWAAPLHPFAPGQPAKRPGWEHQIPDRLPVTARCRPECESCSRNRRSSTHAEQRFRHSSS
jgi:hypothetical protein